MVVLEAQAAQEVPEVKEASFSLADDVSLARTQH